MFWFSKMKPKKNNTWNDEIVHSEMLSMKPFDFRFVQEAMMRFYGRSQRLRLPKMVKTKT